MHLACLQLDVRRGEPELNLAAAGAAVGRAAEAGARLALLPEVWATSFPGEPAGDERLAEGAAEALARAAVWSAEHGILVAGSYLAPGPNLGRQGPGRFFNRLVVHEAGSEVLVYDKVHLFTPTAEHEVFAAGDAPPPVVETSLGLLSGAVCYDLRFAEVFRAMARGGAELVVVPAQWPARRAGHWRALVTGRAVEGQFTLLASNRTGTEAIGRRADQLVFPGNSLLVDPAGEVRAEGRGEELVMGEVELERSRRQRVRVPVAKDRRADLYRAWEADGK